MHGTAMTYPAAYLAFVAHFNRGEYRACVEPLEELWFADRNDFYKALIRLVVGLNQIELGLESGPRFLLNTARELLQPYAPRHEGIDVAALDRFIAEQAAAIDGARGRPLRHQFQIRLDPPA